MTQREQMLEEALYQSIRELSFVQSVENCQSGLCATSFGEALIDAGMKLLGVKDLADHHLHAGVFRP
jgi:hypothetical protein